MSLNRSTAILLLFVAASFCQVATFAFRAVAGGITPHYFARTTTSSTKLFAVNPEKIDLKAELTAYLAKREEVNADEAAKR
jgi:hypothetical protein